jgi:hypothetical protein
MISAMVSRSSSPSSDSTALRPAMKPAGPSQSSGGQAPPPPVQTGWALPISGASQFSMRDLVAPGNVQVIFVSETSTLAEPQGRQRHLRRGCRQLRRTVTAGTQAELVKVDAFPPHRDLDDAVQFAQGAGARHQHTAPYHRADSEQPDPDLHDLAPVGVSYRRGSFNDRSDRLRRSRHFTSSRLNLSVVGTPHFLMLSQQWCRDIPVVGHRPGCPSLVDGGRMWLARLLATCWRRLSSGILLGSGDYFRWALDTDSQNSI